MREMHNEVLKGVENCYSTYAHDSDDFPENGSLIAQMRIFLSRTAKKYDKAFSYLARIATKRMMDRVVKNAESTLKISLNQAKVNPLKVKPNFMSAELKDITQACTMESAELIKLIPKKFIVGVQQSVVTSITTGRGFKDLKADLIEHYKGNSRRAELTALDQTRKAYQSIQAARMKEIGVKYFKWIHSGGGREPRKLHQELSGKVFSFDDPPYIGDMHGKRIHGLPGQLPNCRCVMKPIFDFEINNDKS